jgi:hypothetical protein
MCGRYSSDTLDQTRVHVRENYRGVERDVLLAILSELKRLSHRELVVIDSEFVDTQSSLSESRHNAPMTRELAAILQDRAFAPQKDHLEQLVERYFPEVLPLRPKDSRRRVVERLTAQFALFPPARQRRVFHALRRLYMRDRQANLAEWAEILGKPAADE